jgi:hypothetical protein
MDLRKKSSKKISLSDENETISISNDLPNTKLFVNKFNFCLIKALKPSSRKSGPTRIGFLSISKSQYHALIEMGLTHRFKQQQFLLSHFNLKTSRFYSQRNRVVIQVDTFQARLKRPAKLKFYESGMTKCELQGCEYLSDSTSVSRSFKSTQLDSSYLTPGLFQDHSIVKMKQNILFFLYIFIFDWLTLFLFFFLLSWKFIQIYRLISTRFVLIMRIIILASLKKI